MPRRRNPNKPRKHTFGLTPRIFVSFLRKHWNPKDSHPNNKIDNSNETDDAIRSTKTATWVMAVMALITAVVLGRTDDAYRVANRAFVYFDIPTFRPYPSPQDIQVYAIGVVATNSGNTPAYDVRVRFDCPQTPTNSTKDPWPLAKWSSLGSYRPFLLGPKQPVPLNACGELPKEIFVDTQSHKIEPFIIAEIQYEDAFSRHVIRRTQLSALLRIDGSGNYGFAYIGPHNCSDNDCL